MYAAPVALSDPRRHGLSMLLSRISAFCLLEIQKLGHDRSELLTRTIQPVLWLVIFGETFNRIHAIPTGHVPYLDYLAPGIIAQSALFMAIFYGIQVLWERDAGMLIKLLVTPTPRVALVTGKAFAASIRAVAQAAVVVAVASLLGVAMSFNPLRLAGVVVAVVLGATFFACLSVIIAGLVRKGDRLMGIGQAITMPLFFTSNALYPLNVMPAWLRAISHVNPLTYEVTTLRGLLLGTQANYLLNYGILAGAAILGSIIAAAVLPRVAR